MEYKIGHSTDIHRLEKGNKLILGGIDIPFEKGAVGHSDADCLLHAITEAIIGALGLGDLGTLFPDNDIRYKGIESSYFLLTVNDLLKQKGYRILNIDSTVFLEKPLLHSYIPLMKKNIANILQIAEEQINIKATRGEKLGFIGTNDGVVSEAVVLIKPHKNVIKISEI